MKALRTFAVRRPPPWWLRLAQRCCRLRLDRSDRWKAMPLPGAPSIGSREADAVERALRRWVALQKAASKPVPTRRIDAD